MFIIIRYKSITKLECIKWKIFEWMFFGCSSLSDIKALQNWKVSNGNNFRFMFSGCSSLSDIKALQNWNVSNANNFRYMFYGRSSP